MKEKFIDKNFGKATLDIIEKANEIIELYSGQGYNLTLRQLYYQFVARTIIPNNQKSYKRLGNIINDARLARLIDWTAIDDRTRILNKRQAWDKPSDVLEAARNSYHVDRWRFASNYVEVWVEKEALADVVEQAVYDHDVPSLACKGYPSQTAVYKASKRFIKASRAGKACWLLYLGDHDPSGLDISRDVQDRLTTFRADVNVQRIALNIDQVKQYKLPPNPAKITDSRAKSYIAEFGRESWELDALEPSVITDLIDENIRKIRNDEDFETAVAAERAGRSFINSAIKQVKDSEGDLEDDEEDEDRYDDEDSDDSYDDEDYDEDSKTEDDE